MSDPVYVLLVVLHISFAAVAFGAPLGSPGSVRRARAISRDALLHAANEAMRRGQMAGISGIGILLTGLGLIFYRGGFAIVPHNFHAALGIGLFLVVFGVAFQRPTGARLIEAATKGDDAGITKGQKLLGMGAGITQLMWLVTLVLMFVRF